MTAYKDLQEKAKALDIPYVGVSAEDLEKAIQAKEAGNLTDAKGPEPKATKTSTKTTEKFNTAIVKDKGREVRQYTLEVHGENFAELAQMFAKKKDYTVELKDVKPGQRCPKCGALIE